MTDTERIPDDPDVLFTCLECDWIGPAEDVEWGRFVPPGPDRLKAEAEKTECPECGGDVEDHPPEQFMPCWECGELVDTAKSGVWKAPNDEQWWHEDCFDDLDELEDIVSRLERLENRESYPDKLQHEIRTAHGRLDKAVTRERLFREQKRRNSQSVGTDSGSNTGDSI